MTHPLPQFARERWQPLDGPWGTVEDERITYRHVFRIPDDWERTLLCFGAVDWRAGVFVDGAPVGEHEGGYTHFRFDLGHVRPGEHELVVDVFDPHDDAFGQAKGKQRGSHDIWYTRVTGAWRPVWIEGVPDEYICELDRPNVARPWSPDDPYLHAFEQTLGDDRVMSYVGRRTIEARGRDLYLNGEPLRIAGVLDQGYWPDTIYSATDGQLRADVEAAKAMGFNLVRKHMKVEDPRWYTWCDRLGLLVAQDMPSSHDLTACPEQFKQEWAEIVQQLSRHPSVIVLIPINENWGEPAPELQRELVDIARGNGRLVVDASGWRQQLDHTDLIDVHDYGARLTRHLVHADAELPLWFGELGGVALGGADYAYRNVDDLAGAYCDVVEQVPDDVCGFVWTQLADVDGERNGLLTAERTPKVAFDEIRAVNKRFLRV